MNIVEFAFFIIYKVAFDWLYISVVSVNFEYMGLYKDFNLLKYIVGWILLLYIIYFIIIVLKDEILLYIAKLFLIFSILPQISLWGIKNYSSISIILIMIYWSIFIFCFGFISKIRFFNIEKNSTRGNTKQLNINFFVFLLFIFSVLVIVYISWKYTGLRFILSLANIYELRESYTEISKSTLVNYLLPLTSTVLLPYCFIVFLSEKKYIASCIVLITGILSFSINGMKTWLFIYLAVLFFYIFSNRAKANIIQYLLISLIGATILSGVVYYIADSITLVGLHNRVLSYPSELNFYYYNFFTDESNELLYLRESILRHFFKSPYPMQVPYLISKVYASKDGTVSNAVNGLFGDAYANFGIIGVIIYPVLLSFVMRLVSHLLKYYNDKSYAFSIIFILIWNSVNTSFFTWLLTGGVILYCMLLFINKRFLKTKLINY